MRKQTLTMLVLFSCTFFLPTPGFAQSQPKNPKAEKEKKRRPGLATQGLDPELQERAKVILKAFNKVRHNPAGAGLKSWIADVLVQTDSNRFGRLKAIYAWNAPNEDVVQFPEKTTRKHPLASILKQGLKGIGKDLAGNFLAGWNSKGCKLQCAPGAETPGCLHAIKGKKVVARLNFDSLTKLLTKQEVLTGGRSTTKYTFKQHEGKWVLAGRTLSSGKGRGNVTCSYSAHKKFNNHFLPTVITLSSKRGKMELLLSYQTINGNVAFLSLGDQKKLKETIKEFLRAWSKWNTIQQTEEVAKLADLGGPEVAMALAGKLRTKSDMVKIALAKALGRLAEKKTVSSLISALAKNKKNPEVLCAICRALGDIGDPKAIKPLTKGILAGESRSREWQEQAKERIRAIGAIKDPRAVDELIDLYGKSGKRANRRGGGGGRSQFQRIVQTALESLTGRSFANQQEWKKWWKSTRTSFRFK